MVSNTARRNTPDPYYHTEIVYNDFDDLHRDQSRSAPIRTISYHSEFETSEKENNPVPRNAERNSTRCSGYYSKRCCIGLAIGLVIGLILVIAIAVPVGIVNRTCRSNTASSVPNSVGTFRMDGSCASSTCCCYTDELTFSQVATNQLQMTGKVAGACSGLPSTLSVTQGMPTTFQTLLTWSGETIRLQLGRDSSYISFVNIDHGLCSASGLRTSYNIGSVIDMSLPLIVLLPAVTLGIMS